MRNLSSSPGTGALTSTDRLCRKGYAARLLCLIAVVLCYGTMASAASAGSVEFLGVSCSAVKVCLGVGSVVNGSGETVALGESLGSGGWSTIKTADPLGARSSELFGVSGCGACGNRAVGHSINGSGTEEALVEYWTGASWALDKFPVPSGTKASSANGVSCRAIVVCDAVGAYVNSSGVEMTLAEQTGASSGDWSIKESANPAGARASALKAITCVPCMAVGRYINSAGTELMLAEQKKAETSWVIVETSSPKEAKSSSLGGGSCSTSGLCAAVGHYAKTSGTELALAESWNGKAWVNQEVPTPKQAKISQLGGVSCSTPEVCVAVGRYVNISGTDVALVESWNGKAWVIQETPTPKEAKSSGLASVSCTKAEACTAVGSYTNTMGFTATLTENWNGKEWQIFE